MKETVPDKQLGLHVVQGCVDGKHVLYMEYVTIFCPNGVVQLQARCTCRARGDIIISAWGDGWGLITGSSYTCRG